VFVRDRPRSGGRLLGPQAAPPVRPVRRAPHSQAPAAPPRGAAGVALAAALFPGAPPGPGPGPQGVQAVERGHQRGGHGGISFPFFLSLLSPNPPLSLRMPLANFGIPFADKKSRFGTADSSRSAMAIEVQVADGLLPWVPQTPPGAVFGYNIALGSADSTRG